MNTTVGNILPLTSVGLLLVGALTGCATTSDVDELRRTLRAEMSNAGFTVRAETRELRDRMNALQVKTKAALETEKKAIETAEARLAALAEDVHAETAAVRRSLDELSTRRGREIESLQTGIGDLRRELAGVHTELSSIAAGRQRLQSIATAHSSQIHAITQALMRSYKSGVENLNDQLKELEAVSRDLEPILTTPVASP